MTCSEWENKGILYFYNELEDSVEYQEHIKSCKICPKNLEFLKLLKGCTVFEDPSDDRLEKIYQSSFTLLKDVTTAKHRYFFRIFALGITTALFFLLFLKKDIFKPKKSMPVETVDEMSYISERINKIEKEIELSMLQEEDKNELFRNEIEELNYQLKNLYEKVENL